MYVILFILFFYVQVESTSSGTASNGDSAPSAGEVSIGLCLLFC